MYLEAIHCVHCGTITGTRIASNWRDTPDDVLCPTCSTNYILAYNYIIHPTDRIYDDLQYALRDKRNNASEPYQIQELLKNLIRKGND